MSIATAHKILITCAILFFLFYGLWEWQHYRSTADQWTVVRGAVSVLAAVGLGVYLRAFVRSLKR